MYMWVCVVHVGIVADLYGAIAGGFHLVTVHVLVPVSPSSTSISISSAFLLLRLLVCHIYHTYLSFPFHFNSFYPSSTLFLPTSPLPPSPLRLPPSPLPLPSCSSQPNAGVGAVNDSTHLLHHGKGMELLSLHKDRLGQLVSCV